MLLDSLRDKRFGKDIPRFFIQTAAFLLDIATKHAKLPLKLSEIICWILL